MDIENNLKEIFGNENPKDKAFFDYTEIKMIFKNKNVPKFILNKYKFLQLHFIQAKFIKPPIQFFPIEFCSF
jgi:hypothetical protein